MDEYKILVYGTLEYRLRFATDGEIELLNLVSNIDDSPYIYFYAKIDTEIS